MKRLRQVSDIPVSITGHDADFSRFGIGMVHFGVGAFHRAHQAVYTHDVLERDGGDWRILGVSLRNAEIPDTLNAQDGVYSLVIREAESTRCKIVKSIAHVAAAGRDQKQIIATLSAPGTRIVSMTVTEKAYGILRESGSVDPTHPAIAHDLKNWQAPIGIIGYLVKGLHERFKNDLKPFTVLCCDNLPQNGDLVRQGVIDFAVRTGQFDLRDWIREEGAFPNTMVDRITPATTPELISEVSEILGAEDLMPVETEPFTQWVVEDRFCNGRPAWESVGVLFVENVEPYEEMKLRMLNGAHSMIAYAGFLSGKKYVREVMADPTMAALVSWYMQAAALTLKPLKEIDLTGYQKQLVERFANPAIAHETYQIAMDGSQKMPQRIFQTACEALRRNQTIEPFAFATAAWMQYCSGGRDKEHHALRDPREEELSHAFQRGEQDPEKICEAFHALDELFPSRLVESALWQNTVSKHLGSMLEDGMEMVMSKMQFQILHENSVSRSQNHA